MAMSIVYSEDCHDYNDSHLYHHNSAGNLNMDVGKRIVGGGNDYSSIDGSNFRGGISAMIN